MKQLLEERLKAVLKRLGEVKADTVEHTELVKEMAALIKTIADLEKAEKAKQQEDNKLAFDRDKLSFEKEKFIKEEDSNKEKLDLEREKLDLERDKFTQEQAEKLIETQDNQEKKWWERGFTIGKFILRGIEITVAIIALKYEIFNHISGKADWEAIRAVFRGE